MNHGEDNCVAIIAAETATNRYYNPTTSHNHNYNPITVLITITITILSQSQPKSATAGQPVVALSTICQFLRAASLDSTEFTFKTDRQKMQDI